MRAFVCAELQNYTQSGGDELDFGFSVVTAGTSHGWQRRLELSGWSVEIQQNIDDSSQRMETETLV